MRCHRCHGLMVVDAYLNREGDQNQAWIENRRCVNCGELLDVKILQNRLGHQSLVNPTDTKRAA